MKTRGKFQKVLCLSLSLLMMVSLVACGSSNGPIETDSSNSAPDTGGISADKVVNVACIAPLTGSASRSGEELKNGVEMQLENCNYKVGDYTLKLFWVDSESNAEKGALAYEECILKNDIDIGFMNWHSWVATSCMEVAAKHKIPHFLSFGSSATVVEKVQNEFDTYKYWIGKTWPLPQYLVNGYVETINSSIADGTWTPASKTLGIYGVDEDWGRTFCVAAKEQFDAEGWTTAAEEYFAVGETDYYAVLNKIQNAGCTLLVGTMSDVNAATSFIKQAGEVGLEALIVCDGLGWLGEWYDLTGQASDYVLDMIPQFSTDAGREFAVKYEGKYGYEPGPSTAGLAYDTCGMFVKILQWTLDKYGEINSENAMRCAEEYVMTGELTYSMADDGAIMITKFDYSDPSFYPDPIVGEEYYMFPVIQYFGGKGTVVWPGNMADDSLKVPGSWNN